MNTNKSCDDLEAQKKEVKMVDLTMVKVKTHEPFLFYDVCQSLRGGAGNA